MRCCVLFEQIKRQADILVEHGTHLGKLAEAASNNAVAAKANAAALINGNELGLLPEFVGSQGQVRKSSRRMVAARAKHGSTSP